MTRSPRRRPSAASTPKPIRDYRAWHRDYDEPASSLSQRLQVVQRRLADALSLAPPGPVRLISMCAGQGRDVIPVLARHPRRPDVRAALLEIDAANVARARQDAATAGLSHFDAIEVDASYSDPYASYAPADILLACGIFGNISDADLENTIRQLSMLCREGASVIWTRHWKQPEIIARITQWFQESGFQDVGYEKLDNDRKMGVGMVRLSGIPRPFQLGVRFFSFLR